MTQIEEVEVPGPAVIYCPWCHERHLDEGEWKTRPHHKHLCLKCGKLFRVEPYCYGAHDDEFEICDECMGRFVRSGMSVINDRGYIVCKDCKASIDAEKEEG